MTLLVLGVTHHTAPLAVLDGLSMSAEDAAGLGADAVHSPHVAEAMVLNTCNRLEIFADVANFHASTTDLVDLMAKATGADRETLTQHMHVHYGDRAARHLFLVSSGLDSLVVGEPQILGQVRGALRAAQDRGTAARQLNAATQAALRAAKRIHTSTEIGRNGPSVVSVALGEATKQARAPLSELKVLVVGAGAMSSLAVATLAESGARRVTVLNRTFENAQTLAQRYGLDSAPWRELGEELLDADLVVTCTGSTDVVLTRQSLLDVAGRTPGEHPLVVVDLALPHDSEPEISELPWVTRIALVDLAGLPEATAANDHAEAARVIVDTEVSDFLGEEAARRLDPLVVSLRAHAGEVVATELQRLRARLPDVSPEQWEQVENGMRRTAATLLHTPTVRVKELARQPQGHRFADALHTLFDLPTDVIDGIGGELGAADGDEGGGW